MRPFALDPLCRALTVLPSIGPKNVKYLERLVNGPKVLDLLWHAPVEFIDRRFAPKIADAPSGKIATLTLTVNKHVPASRKSLPTRVQCADDTGSIDLVFFHARGDWLKKQLPEGEQVVVSGKVERFRGQTQMVHPDGIVKPEDKKTLQTIEPVYPLTQGISNKVLNKAINAALSFIPDLPEWLDDTHKTREKWPSWKDALEKLHHPEHDKDLENDSPIRARLAYDEFLANQLTLALVRHNQKKKHGRAFAIGGPLRKKLLASLPFELTGAQQRCLTEIDADMSAPLRMLRLLQGDVGSGKTVMALLAMLNAIETGAQAAIMAPTEILARQHEQSLKPLLDALGIRFVVLTGRNKGKARDLLLQQIANGAAQIIIGTHALFQDDVLFKDLGLAVIDEQHRFGVHQRMKLSAKGQSDGKHTDILVMTATPIPRTLALTAYGDMDISRIDEKPPGRKPVETRLIPNEKMPNMVEGLARQIKEGARVYWVCPLVEESEVLDLAAAQERFEILQGAFGDRVGLIHGRMKPDEKDAVMARFVEGLIDILVATTVIEVGVNVPEATIMVIEHAERFGLSQLHQLRGRVGRGSDKSWCFLLYATRLTGNAKERLKVMRDTEDGFIIAEKDLELRGSGDVLGTKQSGLPDFKIGNIEEQGDLLATARQDAQLIIQKDPGLETPRGQALKTLLYLFECDQAIHYFKGG